MKVLVCGGRDFRDSGLVRRVLDLVHRDGTIGLVIHGDASGADRLSGGWADLRGVPVEKHPADWRKHGRAAGPIRNAEMLGSRPDLVVAFPGGRGTADMVRRARTAGIDVLEVSSRPEEG